MVKLFGKADLHIHSRYSQDSFSTIKNILKRAKEQRLDLIAITDHHTLKGAREAQKISPQFGIEVILGEEIETKEGEIIALFIEKTIAPKRRVLETIGEIHQQGGLVIVPHPLNWFLRDSIQKKTIFQIFEKIDGIELLNGAWTGGIKQKESEELNKLIFNLASLCGSDAHLSRQVGKSYTIFPGNKSEDLYRAIKEKTTFPAGSFWGWGDRFFWLINTSRLFLSRPHFPLSVLYRLIKNLYFKVKEDDIDYYSYLK